jgi:signal transduction histidine kinase
VSFRSRLLLTFLFATIFPLVVLALGVRRQLASRLTAQYEQRVHGLEQIVEQDIAREGATIAARLASLARSLRTDDRFRSVAAGDGGDREYVLDWAGQAMRTSGLSMLQVQDANGRIVSSGHFRNEFDRLDAEMVRALTSTKGTALVRTRAPEGSFLALARVDSVFFANRRFDLVGGVTVDSTFLRRFAREDGMQITLVVPDSVIPSVGPKGGGRGMTIPYAGSPTPARLEIAYTIPELAVLQADVNRWFITAMLVVVSAAVALTVWLATRLSQPLATLTHAASTIDLEGPELQVAAQRDDEIGMLARRMGGLSTRLRASAARLRQAERRATVGDMARQVNHDIKNGLIPIRNVLRHLVQVQEQQPQELATVFAERRSTLESSVGYLDTLARNYARLTPSVEQHAVDVNGIVTEVSDSTASPGTINVRTRLTENLPRALGDRIIVRRILDNLVRNAIESIDARGGDVTLTTSRTQNGGVRIVVADTGRGMSESELARAFDDFYTTKTEGTGLGLSVVRRLTADLNGSLRVESEPGRGTTFTIELPACTPS